MKQQTMKNVSLVLLLIFSFWLIAVGTYPLLAPIQCDVNIYLSTAFFSFCSFMGSLCFFVWTIDDDKKSGGDS